MHTLGASMGLKHVLIVAVISAVTLAIVYRVASIRSALLGA